MKNNNLFHSIYEHSFSLFLTFLFYAIIIAVLLSCEEETPLTSTGLSESKVSISSDRIHREVDLEQKIENNQDFIVEK